ncbi:AAA family ATPase [Photobacterium lipolyticum]|uniref:Chromosome partitioning protein ParA n=1 Tax=Photobacterium lipolyticum TaxID=266810 RepID=A0A2T3N4R7_9GAMM|nr:chromosome partitioning protein ParA [Photobacterium lipolyticum]PSW07394.1 chromosome partitioning protein ParA [Photobacterium lipolyticum]
MFDIAKAISQTAEKKKVQQGPSGCSLFYQTDSCKELLQEVFRFEGWSEPDCVKNTLPQPNLKPKGLEEIIILELNQSDNVVEDAKAFASRLPNHKGIIVIGQEDAITTLRGLKEMGLYYLFWPINKQEASDFIRHVHSNIERFTGVSQNRKAKKVAIIGSKGGIGTTLISAEIASKLASSGTDTILVDHQYHTSNIDIMLGLKNFEKQNAENLGLQFHDMDEESAAGYLQPISNNLRMLALSGNVPVTDLLGYSHSIVDLLHRQANFIIEDYSGSADFKLDIPLLVKRSNVIVLVIEPTVASVRNARQLMESICQYRQLEQKELRLFLFVNVHRPDAYFPLKPKEIEEHLEKPIDVVLPYNRNFAAMLLQGQRLHKQNANLAGPFHDISLLLNGKLLDSKGRKLSLTRLFNRVKR